MILRQYPFESWIALAILSLGIGGWKFFKYKKMPIDYLTIILCAIILTSSVLSAIHFYK
jgi:hypothetical protein